MQFRASRLARHSGSNDVIKRTLQTLGVPCLQEAPGLSRDVGRKPDGITMLVYANGKPLCWDRAYVDIFASTYVNESAVRVGSAGIVAATIT